MIRKLKGQASKYGDKTLHGAFVRSYDANMIVLHCRQARQMNECLKLTRDLLTTSARDVALAIRVGAQQVRVEFTAKHLKRAEAQIRELQEAYKHAKEQLMKTAKQAMQLKRHAEDEAPWDEHEEAFAGLSDDLDDLRGRIENNKASLDCFRGDRSIREVYRQACEEIEKDEAELKKLETFVNSGENAINDIKVAVTWAWFNCHIEF